VDHDTLDLLTELGIATGLGLFVGLEREHTEAREQGDTEVKREPLLGVRTFALLALFGWTSSFLSQWAPWLPPVALLVTGGLIGAQYVLGRERGLGLTTEVAAVVTFVLGMLVHWKRELAVALGLGTTLLLISKPWVRSIVPKLRRIELTATLQLLIVLAVVLPLLPEKAPDVWGVLSPRKIGLFVALIAGISYVGYVLTRLFGRSHGAWMSGIVGGLASSTAVTAAMSQQARRDQTMRVPGQLAVFLANMVMCLRVVVVTAIISTRVARSLALPLGIMAAALLAAAVWKWRVLRRARVVAQEAPLELRNPFALVPALKWGAILCAVLVVSAVAKQYLGDQGVLLTAAASGLADVDAITLTVTRSAAIGQLSTSVAILAVTIAVLANTVVKGAMAWVMGGRAFGRDVAIVFSAAMAGGIGAALLQ
jgi:uncharacterized membrane protein (DUF4010 family)